MKYINQLDYPHWLYVTGTDIELLDRRTTQSLLPYDSLKAALCVVARLHGACGRTREKVAAEWLTDVGCTGSAWVQYSVFVFSAHHISQESEIFDSFSSSRSLWARRT